jgi:hypothetical protein
MLLPVCSVSSQFLVSWFYFQPFRNLFPTFFGQKVCIPLFFWKISSQLMSIGFYSFAWGSKFRFLIEELGGGGGASALHIFILADFWTEVGLNMPFGITSIWANFVIHIKSLSKCFGVAAKYTRHTIWNTQVEGHKKRYVFTNSLRRPPVNFILTHRDRMRQRALCLS